LVQNQILSVTQVEHTLQRQVISGGDLPTNILELKILDEDTLLAFISKLYDIPPADPSIYNSVSKNSIDLFDSEFAFKNKFLPLKIDDNILFIAVTSPLSDELTKTISQIVNLELRPLLVLEFRLSMLMSRYYNIDMPGRMASLYKKLKYDFDITYKFKETGNKSTETSDVKIDIGSGKNITKGESTTRIFSGALTETQQTFPSKLTSDISTKQAPFVVTVNDDDETVEGVEIQNPAETQSSKDTSSPKNVDIIKESDQQPEPVAEIITEPEIRKGNKLKLINYSTAKTLLENTKNRDEIIDVFYHFAHQAFEFSLLATVIGSSVQGRLAGFLGEEPVDAQQVEIELEGDNLFTKAVDNLKPEIGAMDSKESIIFLNQIGRDIPLNAAVIPVILKDRAILIFYGDSGQNGVRHNRVEKLGDFAALVSEAFERLLLKRKFSKYKLSDEKNNQEQEDVKKDLIVKDESHKIKEITDSRKTKKDLSAWVTPVSNDNNQKREETINIVQTKQRDKEESTLKVGLPVSKEVTNAKKTLKPASSENDQQSKKPDIELQQEKISDTTSDITKDIKLSRPIGNSEDAQSKASENRSEGLYIHVDKTGIDNVNIDKTGIDKQAQEQEHDKKIEITEKQPNGVYIHVEKKEDRIRRHSNIPLPPPKEEQNNLESVTYPVTNEMAAKAVEIKNSLNNYEENNVNSHKSIPPAAEPILLQQRTDEHVKDTLLLDIEGLVQNLISSNPGEGTVRQLLDAGEVSIATIISHFPGPLLIDRYQEMVHLSPVSYHGPLLRTLTLFGKKVVPYILPLLESFDSEIRFYATYLFSEVASPDVLVSLVNRLFDNDRQIRTVTVDIVKKFSGLHEYKQVIENISMVLADNSTPLDKKRLAAEVLGDLQDKNAVLPLASMLGSVDGILAERCQKALIKITLNDFGYSERKWVTWFSNNRDLNRLEWAIESIIHQNENLRRAAITVVKDTIGDTIELPRPPYDFKQRQLLHDVCKKWWSETGIKLFSS
ncbi:MAG: hypothetical protein JXR91_17405, partial [Deltaproteobacteria bacterium]|nr:hypothetical protein [Deltaproteobacteria bacterium]